MTNRLMKMLTIGVSGASCSGKTSVATMLEKSLPRCSIINQDAYYFEEESSLHVRDQKTNLINWEVLEAFDMEKMQRDISVIRKNAQISKTSFSDNLVQCQSGSNTKLKSTPILIIEGIIIFRDPKILEQCDMKYFIEIDRDNCKERREARVWDPEGSSWEENPEYFENIAWPEYRNCVAEMKQLEGIKFLDSNTDTIEKNFEIIISDIMKKIKA